MMGVVNINLNNLSEKKEEMTKKKFIKSINAENNRLISIIDLKSIIDAKKEAAYN